MTLKIPFYQVDAFAEKAFEGNPAAVCPLDEWLPDDVMQKIALENNLSETAFFVPSERPMRIRWFTPNTEVKLCGHATLASAHVLLNYIFPNWKTIEFESLSGKLGVKVSGNLLTLNFPLDKINQLATDHPIADFFEPRPVEVWQGDTDYLLVYRDQEDVEGIQVNFDGLRKQNARGVIVTSPSSTFDFISRGFFPACGVNEDPVTGSAHTTLAAYWGPKTGNSSFKARQVSDRGGNLVVELKGDRVLISGRAITVIKGVMEI